VHGLSVSGDGGAVLPIEVLALPGKGELRLTGRQGEVMREAAEAARSFLRSRAADYGIEASLFQTRDLHVHLPEAAIKKDGPSAGVATFLAMLSALTGRAARGDVAVTGELTLLGEVLPVGGVRAKVLAAERAGLSQVVLPQENIADVPDDARIPRVHIERVHEAVDVVLEASPHASTGS
jgi:ATP-dependent Lon protease